MRIAVVGAGIAGLSAAYHLREVAAVTLFEDERRLGGHTYTVPVPTADGRELAIDMGFIVYNESTYPTFSRLLDELGVATEASTMSFSMRCERSGLEYCGSSLPRLFAQKRNLLSPGFYRMLLGILRFHREVPTLLGADPGLSLGAYLARARYPRTFVDHYLLPICSAIWSTPGGAVGELPLSSLARFLHNHGMATIDDRPTWRVVSGGSQRYVERLVVALGARVAFGPGVRQIVRQTAGVVLRLADGQQALFDAVIVACHSDQALALLDDPTPEERSILGALPYADNEATLHTDRRFLPRRPQVRSAWNFHLTAESPRRPQLTYWMNELQNLREPLDYCVTLNRHAEIAPERVLHRATFAHPQFTTAGLAAQQRWAEISQGLTFYAGAYWRYGFHEDGCRSGQRAAEAAFEALSRRAAA